MTANSLAKMFTLILLGMAWAVSLVVPTLAMQGIHPSEPDKEKDVLVQSQGFNELQDELAQRITEAPPRRMQAPGLAGAMGGASLRVFANAPQEVLLPMPQWTDGQVPIGYFMTCTPNDAVADYRLHRSEQGNAMLKIRLAGKKQEVRLTWSAIVLVSPHIKGVEQHSLEPYRQPSKCVQADADEITKLAAHLWPASGQASDFAARLQQHIRGMKRIHPPRSLDALSILKSGENGICTANANLAAALMRAKGIPCRTLAVIPPIAQRLEMHRIVAYFDKDRWQLFDPSSLHADIPCQPWQNLILHQTTFEDEQAAMKRRMGVMLGCPYGQEIEMLSSGVSLFGQDFYWTLAKPLAEFNSTPALASLAVQAWEQFLATGQLTPGQRQARSAQSAAALAECLRK